MITGRIGLHSVLLQARRRGDSKDSNEPPLEVNNVDFQLLTNSGRIENKL